jgi:hypothetical protein
VQGHVRGSGEIDASARNQLASHALGRHRHEVEASGDDTQRRCAEGVLVHVIPQAFLYRAPEKWFGSRS